MNILAEELKDNPELAEELLIMAGKIGLACLTQQLRLQKLDIEELTSLVSKTIAQVNDVKRDNEKFRQRPQTIPDRSSSVTQAQKHAVLAWLTSSNARFTSTVSQFLIRVTAFYQVHFFNTPHRLMTRVRRSHTIDE